MADLLRDDNKVPIQNLFRVIKDDRRTVPTAGTRVQLSTTSIACKELIIMALISNTDTIVYGGSTVVAGTTLRSGIPLQPGQSAKISISDLSNVFLDSVVSGDGVSYIYMQ